MSQQLCQSLSCHLRFGLGSCSVHLNSKNLQIFLGAERKPLEIEIFTWGGDVAQLVEHRTGHAADAGLILQCGEGFFSQSQLSVQTLSYGVRIPPCATTSIYGCAHFKDPIVPVRVRWIMETLKRTACTVGWVARLCRSWLSTGREGNPNLPREKFHWDTVVKS